VQKKLYHRQIVLWLVSTYTYSVSVDDDTLRC
jgi:hypothetical protein